MTKPAPNRDRIIKSLFNKFGKRAFRFTDLQREIVEQHWLNYDLFENYPIAWDPVTYHATKFKRIRVYRGWYTDAIYGSHSYFYRKTADGLQLKKIGRGKYQITKR